MKKKGQKSTIVLIVALIAGLSLLLYPSVANYWNSFHASRAMSSYSEGVANLSKQEYETILNAARAYNEELAMHAQGYALTNHQRDEYKKLLDITGAGIMGEIDIPSIHVSLPIYHGTSDEVLQMAVGHLEWTSLPVGGTSSHCVLSGHRGLPSAKLFTHLDRLQEGDIFRLRVLNEVLSYEVDQILIVEPENTEPLQIVNGEDYCTLVTCTPYGINTHRLLVRGHRVENDVMADTLRISFDAIQIEPELVASIIAIPLLLIFVAAVSFRKRRTKTELEQTRGEANE